MKRNLLIIFSITVFISEAQVSLVKDLNTSASSNPNGLFAYDNKIYFKAGSSLYSSDGTDSGTVPFQTSNSFVEPYFMKLNNDLYYSRQFTPGQRGLFKFDGTSETQLSTAFVVRYLTKYGSANKIIFQSDGANSTDWEIWQSDGTPSGTYELADITGSDLTGSDAKDFLEANGKVYFTAYGIVEAKEIYISDGTTSGTVLLKNINQTVGVSSDPGNLTQFNNKVYFTADNGADGRELWVTDGTSAGTQMVFDLYTGATGSNPENLTVFNNALYFTADNPSLGTEIFKMTTSETITSLKNIASGGGSSSPSNLFVFNNKLYFSADDNINGRELWSSTGFSSTTNMLKNINTDAATPDSNPTGFTEYFGELFFSANDGTNGIELWKTDGTAAGTVLVSDINTSGDSSPENLIVAGDNLFFSATTPATGRELFKYRNPSLSINDVELENSISLYPNPAVSSFSIKSKAQINAVTINNIQGKSVKTFSGDLENYDIKELTAGLYFVNIETPLGTLTKKLLKQ